MAEWRKSEPLRCVFSWMLFSGIFLLLSGSCLRYQEGETFLQNKKKLALADSLNHFNPKAADSVYRILLADSSESNRENYIHALIGLSESCRHLGTFDTAGALLARAIESASSMQDTALLMKCYLSQGNMYLDFGNSVQSEICYNQGLEIARKNKNTVYQHKFLLSLGNSQHDRGEYQTAVKTFTEGLKIAEQTGDGETLASALENLAFTIKYTGDINEAIAYMTRSLKIRKKLNMVREYAMGLQNMGILYRNAGKNDSALIVYKQAYDLLCSMNDSVNMVKVRYNTGIILKNQKKYLEAEKEMNSILRFCRQKNMNEGQVYTLSALASVYEQTNRVEKGLVAIDSAISMARRLQLNANLSLLFDRRQDILVTLGNYQEAYHTAQASKDLSDSLLSIDKQKEIATLKIRFETERKEAENVSLKKDLEIQRSKLWLLWMAMILGFAVLIVVLALLYTRNKQIKQQKLLMEEKSIRAETEKRRKEAELEKILLAHQLREQELVHQTLVHAQLTQLNRSVREKLLPFKLKMVQKKSQEDFTQILNEITRDAGRDPMAEFDLVFKQLHNSFYEKLLTISPELSKTELQVAALIRLNLSTKDIARLTNLNITTIEMTRHHIRKKLRMEQHENLTTFLITV